MRWGGGGWGKWGEGEKLSMLEWMDGFGCDDAEKKRYDQENMQTGR